MLVEALQSFFQVDRRRLVDIGCLAEALSTDVVVALLALTSEVPLLASE